MLKAYTHASLERDSIFIFFTGEALECYACALAWRVRFYRALHRCTTSDHVERFHCEHGCAVAFFHVTWTEKDFKSNMMFYLIIQS